MSARQPLTPRDAARLRKARDQLAKAVSVRDAEVTRAALLGAPLRAIAEEAGMSTMSVQRLVASFRRDEEHT